MKKFEEIKAQSLVALICDCCGRESIVDGNDFEASEFISLDFIGGYQSVFGDQTHVSIDICQYCLKEKLGTWLKTTNKASDDFLTERGSQEQAERESLDD